LLIGPFNGTNIELTPGLNVIVIVSVYIPGIADRFNKDSFISYRFTGLQILHFKYYI